MGVIFVVHEAMKRGFVNGHPDVKPGKAGERALPYEKWMRFSFGPPMENMKMGLERLERLERMPPEP